MNVTEKFSAFEQTNKDTLIHLGRWTDSRKLPVALPYVAVSMAQQIVICGQSTQPYNTTRSKGLSMYSQLLQDDPAARIYFFRPESTPVLKDLQIPESRTSRTGRNKFQTVIRKEREYSLYKIKVKGTSLEIYAVCSESEMTVGRAKFLVLRACKARLATMKRHSRILDQVDWSVENFVITKVATEGVTRGGQVYQSMIARNSLNISAFTESLMQK